VVARARGNEVRLVGAPDEVGLARKVLEELYGTLREGHPVHARDVRQAVRMVTEQPDVDLQVVYEDVLAAVGSRRRISAKNVAQREYIDLMRTQDVVLTVGPAGTGKTYLAMAVAVAALNRHEVSRIVLTRPAVEAGEKLGFLPGSMAEKVNPYLRPLYDALNDMMNFEKASRLIERGVIEVAPLAFMRGRTLNDSFVILDEAQNTTSEQMKMFLTRLGFDSKAVITGDVTQIDLPSEQASGLVEALRILEGTEGIGFMRFTEKDVVRHPLVQSIIRAYERHERATGRDQRNGRQGKPAPEAPARSEAQPSGDRQGKPAPEAPARSEAQPSGDRQGKPAPEAPARSEAQPSGDRQGKPAPQQATARSQPQASEAPEGPTARSEPQASEAPEGRPARSEAQPSGAPEARPTPSAVREAEPPADPE
jgi:phosphate starvation-inducible PhoH-like protein